MSASVLTVQELAIAAGAKPLLESLSLQLNAGECLGLVGESGSGKSLTALALLGLLPSGLQATGQLRHEDRAIALCSREHAALRGRVLGWVPQDPLASLHPLRTVGAQLVETLRAVRGLDRDSARREAEALFARVQLPEPASALRRYPHQFSGGQRQRIAIAIALAAQPRVLIADEPTSALDARIARDILDLLDALRREEGLSLLLISHDLPLVGAYAQRLLVLQRGRVVEHGQTRAVFAEPKHDYTRELLAADRLEPLPAPSAVAPLLLRGEHLRLRYPRAPRDALDDVSIDLHRGEGLALVGESGSGKSTLGRVLLRLLRGAQGQVRFDGVDLGLLDRKRLRAVRARMGAVFQDPYASLDPRLRIDEVVTEPLRIHGRGEIMGHEQQRQAAFALELGKQREDGGAVMRVQRRHRLVAHQQVRIGRQRARDRDSLALAAAELMRIAIEHRRFQPHCFQQLRRACAA